MDCYYSSEESNWDFIFSGTVITPAFGRAQGLSLVLVLFHTLGEVISGATVLGHFIGLQSQWVKLALGESSAHLGIFLFLFTWLYES